MIEHRWSRRIDADHEVVIIANENCLIPAKIRNLSRDGLYIEAKTTLPRNSFVKVLFTLSGKRHSPAKQAAIPAMVVHRSRDGMGLIIDPSIPETRTQLHALWNYYGDRAQAAAARIHPAAASRGSGKSSVSVNSNQR